MNSNLKIRSSLHFQTQCSRFASERDADQEIKILGWHKNSFELVDGSLGVSREALPFEINIAVLATPWIVFSTGREIHLFDIRTSELCLVADLGNSRVRYLDVFGKTLVAATRRNILVCDLERLAPKLQSFTCEWICFTDRGKLLMLANWEVRHLLSVSVTDDQSLVLSTPAFIQPELLCLQLSDDRKLLGLLGFNSKTIFFCVFNSGSLQPHYWHTCQIEDLGCSIEEFDNCKMYLCNCGKLSIIRCCSGMEIQILDGVFSVEENSSDFDMAGRQLILQHNDNVQVLDHAMCDGVGTTENGTNRLHNGNFPLDSFEFDEIPTQMLISNSVLLPHNSEIRIRSSETENLTSQLESGEMTPDDVLRILRGKARP